MLIDERGGVFDGDDIMALLGRKLSAEGKLAGNAVVATVMSNFGLEVALRDAGVRLVRTEVGDPAVAREMRQNSYNLGGEQSGHVIFMDHSTTGDGLISALMVLAPVAWIAWASEIKSSSSQLMNWSTWRSRRSRPSRRPSRVTRD